jgi:hypothetical protein
MRNCRGLLELRQRGGSGVGQHPGPGECMRAQGRESAWALASALSEDLAELARGDQMAPKFLALKNSNRNEPTLSLGCRVQPRESESNSGYFAGRNAT